MHRRWRTSLAGVVALVAAAFGAPASVAANDRPPGSPGVDPGYLPADKQGFGTSRTRDSPVWFTLGHGGATEIYYPNLSTPASRSLQVVVTDGEDFAKRLSDVPTRTEPVDAKVPSYRQISTGKRFTVTATYVTDPARPSVMVDLRVVSSTGEPLETYVLHEPTLSADGSDDSGRSVGKALVASDGSSASAVAAEPAFTATSTGYLGTSDGWTDLSENKTLTRRYSEAGPGNIGQVGRLPVDGVDRQRAVVTLSYGPKPSEALSTARRSLARGFSDAAKVYARGWFDYLGSLKPAPESLATKHQRDAYWSSLVMLAASEDKRTRGAFVASPSMPWAWGDDPDLSPTPGPYHLVWPRDLYHHATALLAAGDGGAANRAWEFLVSVQRPDGHYPQNTTTTGEPYWTSIQLDETALPIVLAWQLGRTDPRSLNSVRKAAEFLVTYSKNGHTAPWTEQDRWENQSGYSPATIAAAIAGLVCAADMLEKAGDSAAADRYRAVADRWASKVDSWTVTSNGPLSEQPYYLRLSKNGDPNKATRYDPGDNYPGTVDQRTQVSPGFLELVRLGVKPADDPVIRNTIEVVDRVLGERTPAGRFWHRFTSDGYGEMRDGSQWNLGEGRTFGRLWPIFAGERGEYELVLGKPEQAAKRLAAMARTTNEGLLMAEQVWGHRKPAGDGDPRAGTPTRSATPLAWTHAQYVRLAWSIEKGEPVERPSVVVNRYVND